MNNSRPRTPSNRATDARGCVEHARRAGVSTADAFLADAIVKLSEGLEAAEDKIEQLELKLRFKKEV